MVAVLLSRIIIVLCGILYPAYSSFKAVRAKSHRDYTKWMMYWIVFALFQAAETMTDTFLSWLPFYYELKIIFVLWLVLPITQGSKQLYRLIIHPFLVRHEDRIDEYITQAGHQGLAAVRKLSREGLNRAATTVVSSAIRGQAVITETLQRAQESQSQNHTDGGEGGAGEVQQRRRREYHSSTDSEPFEVIEEETNDQLTENGSRQHPKPADSAVDNGSSEGEHID